MRYAGVRSVLDIEIAKSDVRKKDFTLSIVKDGKMILQSKTPGVSALVTAIEMDRQSFRGASAADKVLGRAAAMLFVYSEVKCVFALLASQDAIATLERFGMPFECEKTVAKILNRNQTSTCPFESLIQDVENPQDAFEKLKTCKIG
jgi:hypothetical protein